MASRLAEVDGSSRSEATIYGIARSEPTKVFGRVNSGGWTAVRMGLIRLLFIGKNRRIVSKCPQIKRKLPARIQHGRVCTTQEAVDVDQLV